MPISDETKLLLPGFPKGLNNVRPVKSLGPDELETADNVDIYVRGRTRSRPSPLKIYDGSPRDIHVAGDFILFTEGTQLKLAWKREVRGHIAALQASQTSALPTTTLRSDMRAVGRCAFLTYSDGLTYFCDGGSLGAVAPDGTLRPWAPPHPSSLGVPTKGPGALPVGEYKVNLVYVDAWGREGPTGAPLRVSLTSPGSIELGSIVTPPAGVDRIRVFMSETNGKTQYQVREILSGISSVTLDGLPVGRGRPLRTQFKSEPPMGSMLAQFNGRMCMVAGELVYFTQPWTSLFDLSSDVMIFEDNVKMFMPVKEGLFVGDSAIRFLRGTDPEKQNFRTVANAKPIPRCAAYADPDDVGTDEQNMRPGLDSKIALFLTESGMYAGYPDGAVRNMTRDRFQPNPGIDGSAMIRKTTGLAQFVSTVQRFEEDVSGPGPVIPAGAITTESGDVLQTESGDYIVTE